MSIEEHLAQSVFERNAEKCASDKDRIAFCKAYLKKHGVDIEPKPATIKYDLSHIQDFGREDTFTFHAKHRVTSFELLTDDTRGLEMYVHRELVRKLSEEIASKGFLRVEKYKNFENDAMDYHGAIKVAKWK